MFSLFTQKILIVETRLKTFSRDLSKVLSMKETLLQLMMNWHATTDSFSSILSFLSMLFLLFSARFNLLYDVIMLPGTITTVLCYPEVIISRFFQVLQYFYEISLVKI